ncbi:hypothetical protein PYJP_18320 [Pyrofollis japonicus]|uniref:Brix domain-containing protein n=1 Tax=Pyrofollis japonicus TaxID=3060460 RepID=UPI00295C06B9|nr:Brix domain containing protein [Pyrofollis japonicus]BEP18480.1 hypothetical protein PYJP_18320 [Pyrofollis japonicus]
MAQKADIVVTTSHRPSQRVRSFVKDLVAVLPNAVKISRGKATIQELYYEVVARGAKRLVIVTTWKGNPGSLKIYEPLEPPEARLELIVNMVLGGVRLSRETPGAQRSFGSKSLGVYIEQGVSKTFFSLSDTLARAFLARIVFSREDTSVDTIAVIRPHQESIAEIVFICPASGRICGPTLRLLGVRDYVSGFSAHKARRLEAARSRSTD